MPNKANIKYRPVTEAGLEAIFKMRQGGPTETTTSQITTDSPFTIGYSTVERDAQIRNNYAEYQETLSDVMGSLSPYLKKEYNRNAIAYSATIGLAGSIASGAQQASVNLGTSIPSFMDAQQERAARNQLLAWSGANLTKEDNDALQDAVNKLITAGYTKEEIMDLNPDNVFVNAQTGQRPQYGEQGQEYVKLLNLTDRQKEAFSKLKEYNQSVKNDEFSRRTNDLFGEEMNGRFSFTISPSLNYNWNFRGKGFQAEWETKAGEAVGQILPELAITTGGAGLAKGAQLLGKGLSAAVRARKFATALNAISAKQGLFQAATYGKLVAQRTANMAAARWARPMGALASLAPKGVVFSSSFIRGYNDMRAFALANGATFDKANQLGWEGGLSNAVTELMEMDWIAKGIKPKGFLSTYFNNVMLPEAGQEAMQTLGEDIIKTAHGLQEFDMKEILVDVVTAAALGAVGGAIFSFGGGFSKNLAGMVRSNLKSNKEISALNDFLSRKNQQQTQQQTQQPVQPQGQVVQPEVTTQPTEQTTQQPVTPTETETTQETTVPQTEQQETITPEVTTEQTQEQPKTEPAPQTEQQEAPKRTDEDEWSDYLNKKGSYEKEDWTRHKFFESTKEADSERKNLNKDQQKRFDKGARIILHQGKNARLGYNEVVTIDYEEYKKLKEKAKTEKELKDSLDEYINKELKKIAKQETSEKKSSAKLTVQDTKAEQPIAGTQTEDFTNAEKDLFNYYKHLHLERNPSATDEQIEAGWNIVKKTVFAEANGTIHIVDMIDRYANAMFDNVNIQNDYVRKNAERLKKEFDGLLTPEVIEAITSPDLKVRFETQFDIAQKSIKAIYKDMGYEATGNLVAALFKRMYYDYAVFGGVDPLQTYNKMFPKIVDIGRARLNGQLQNGTVATHSLLDDINKLSDSLAPDEALKTITEYIGLFHQLEYGFDDKSGRTSAQREKAALVKLADFFISKDNNNLYKDISTNKNKMMELFDLFVTRAHEEKRILLAHNGPKEIVANLDFDAFIAMAIMREMGYGQEKISAVINPMRMDGMINTKQEYHKALQKAYPKLNKQELEELNKLIDAVSEGGNIDDSHYIPKDGGTIMKGLAQRHGELVHESVHWLITNALMREALILKKGLPAGNVKLRALLGELSAKYSKIGLVTGEKMQETIIDGLMDSLAMQNLDMAPQKLTEYLSKRTPRDRELAKLFKDVMEEISYRKVHPEDSVYALATKNRESQKGMLSLITQMFDESATQKIIEQTKKISNMYNSATKKELIDETKKMLNQFQASIPGVEQHQLVLQAMAKEGVPVFEVKHTISRILNNVKMRVVEKTANQNILDKKEGKWKAKKDYTGTNVKGNHTAKDYLNLANLQLKADKNINDLSNNILNFTPAKNNNTNAPVAKKKMLSSRTDIISNVKRTVWNMITNPDVAMAKIGNIWHDFSTTAYQDAAALSNEFYDIVFTSMHDMKERDFKDKKLIMGLHDLMLKYKDSIPDADFDDLQLILFNGDIIADDGTVYLSVERMQNWFNTHFSKEDADTAVEAILKMSERFEWYNEQLKAHGLDYIDNINGFYFPRFVKDTEGFARANGHEHSLSQTTKTRMQAAEKGLSGEDLINNLSYSMVESQNDPTKLTVLMHRTNKMINNAELPFYADIFESAMKYCQSTSQTIMQRELFGKVQKDADGKLFGFDSQGNPTTNFHTIIQAQDGKVGRWLHRYYEQNKGKVNEKALANMERSLYNISAKTSEKNAFWDPVIQLSTLFNLTQFTNTVNQLGEMQTIGARFGAVNMKNALIDVLSKKEGVVNLDDIFSTENEISQLTVGDARNLIARAIKTSQKYTGFTFADAVMKESTMRAGVLYTKQAIQLEERKAKGEQLSSIEEQTLAEANRLMYRACAIDDIDAELKIQNNPKIAKLNQLKQDLMNDVKSDLSMKYQEQLLTDVQPIDLGSRLTVLNGGGAFLRGAMLFKSVGIRQTAWIANYFYDGFKKGGTMEGSRRIANFIVLGLLCGVAKEALLDIVNGKKPEAHFWEGVQGPLFLNSYIISVAKKEGWGEAVNKVVSSPFGFLNPMSKDVMSVFSSKKKFKFETSKNIPVVGKFVWNMFLGGYKQHLKDKEELFRW